MLSDSDSIPTIESSYILQSSTTIPIMRNMLNGNEDDASSDPGPHTEHHQGIQEDWGLVNEEDPTHGVLILAASDEIEPVSSDNDSGHHHHHPNFPTTLSVPGIDSIPSDIGSIPDQRELSKLLQPLEGHDDDGDHMLSGSNQILCSQEEIQELKMLTKRGYTVIGLLTMFFMLTTSFLVYERQAWKTSNHDLEAQLRQIEEQLNKTKTNSKPAIMNPAAWLLAGELCYACNDSPENPPSIGKLMKQGGKCAHQARESVQAKAKEIGKIAVQVQEDFVTRAQTSVTKAQEVIAVKAQEVLDKVDDGAQNIRKALKPENAKKIIPAEWKKIATTVVGGVVTVSLAALFADDVGDWIDGQMNNNNNNNKNSDHLNNHFKFKYRN